MKRIHTDKRFIIYEIDAEELRILRLFGEFGNICDDCNVTLEDKVFYVPVLNYGLCEECCKDWIERATYFPEDEDYILGGEKHIESLAEKFRFDISDVNDFSENSNEHEENANATHIALTPFHSMSADELFELLGYSLNKESPEDILVYGDLESNHAIFDMKEKKAEFDGEFNFYTFSKQEIVKMAFTKKCIELNWAESPENIKWSD